MAPAAATACCSPDTNDMEESLEEKITLSQLDETAATLDVIQAIESASEDLEAVQTAAARCKSASEPRVSAMLWSAAAKKGHLHVMQWLQTHIRPLDRDAFLQVLRLR